MVNTTATHMPGLKYIDDPACMKCNITAHSHSQTIKERGTTDTLNTDTVNNEGDHHKNHLHQVYTIEFDYTPP